MNGRQIKKLRRLAAERDRMILPELKAWINNLDVWDRLRVSFRIALGKF